jgi:hypothetical protein
MKGGSKLGGQSFSSDIDLPFASWALAPEASRRGINQNDAANVTRGDNRHYDTTIGLLPFTR